MHRVLTMSHTGITFKYLGIVAGASLSFSNSHDSSESNNVLLSQISRRVVVKTLVLLTPLWGFGRRYGKRETRGPQVESETVSLNALQLNMGSISNQRERQLNVESGR
ncbi:hypothetical protein ACMFMG_004101 [Clarireedia jacksonii]